MRAFHSVTSGEIFAHSISINGIELYILLPPFDADNPLPQRDLGCLPGIHESGQMSWAIKFRQLKNSSGEQHLQHSPISEVRIPPPPISGHSPYPFALDLPHRRTVHRKLIHPVDAQQGVHFYLAVSSYRTGASLDSRTRQVKVLAHVA